MCLIAQYQFLVSSQGTSAPDPFAFCAGLENLPTMGPGMPPELMMALCLVPICNVRNTCGSFMEIMMSFDGEEDVSPSVEQLDSICVGDCTSKFFDAFTGMATCMNLNETEENPMAGFEDGINGF